MKTQRHQHKFARARRCDKRLRVLDDMKNAETRTERRIIFHVDTTDIRPPMVLLVSLQGKITDGGVVPQHFLFRKHVDHCKMPVPYRRSKGPCVGCYSTSCDAIALVQNRVSWTFCVSWRNISELPLSPNGITSSMCDATLDMCNVTLNDCCDSTGFSAGTICKPDSECRHGNANPRPQRAAPSSYPSALFHVFCRPRIYISAARELAVSRSELF